MASFDSRFTKYLATGDYESAQDSAPVPTPAPAKKSAAISPESVVAQDAAEKYLALDAAPVDLAAHDRRFHPNGYKPGSPCKVRKSLDKGNIVDLFKAEESERDSRNRRHRYDEEKSKQALLKEYQEDGNAILDEKKCAKARELWWDGIKNGDESKAFAQAIQLASGLYLTQGGFYTHPSGDPIPRSHLEYLAFYDNNNHNHEGDIPRDFGDEALLTFQNNVLKNIDAIVGFGDFDRLVDTFKGIQKAADVFGVEVAPVAHYAEAAADLFEKANKAATPMFRQSVNADWEEHQKAMKKYESGMQRLRPTIEKWTPQQKKFAERVYQAIENNWRRTTSLGYTERVCSDLSEMLKGE